jgi:hypothetical protein
VSADMIRLKLAAQQRESGKLFSSIFVALPVRVEIWSGKAYLKVTSAEARPP